MTLAEFEASLNAPAPPGNLGVELSALWWLRNSNWERAHELIDQHPGTDAAWVHALLHRMEGDQANANYWYARAGRQRTNQTIGQELAEQLAYFLGRD